LRVLQLHAKSQAEGLGGKGHWSRKK
jgi:hypothetical protein